MTDFEPIYAALFARLSTAALPVTKSRVLRHWADVPSEEQPAMFQAQTGIVVRPETNKPTQYLLKSDVYVYVRAAGDEVPATKLNALLLDIFGTLAPDKPYEGRCTLGGLVHYARVSGDVETDEGTLGDQAVAIVPIEILTTD